MQNQTNTSDNELLDQKETAKLLYIKPTTLSLWRRKGKFLDKNKKRYLPFNIIGSHILYRRKHIMNFLKSCEVCSTNDLKEIQENKNNEK